MASAQNTDSVASAVEISKTPTKYPSLLWQVSGKGLKKPSYLYGTMHVSRKMVFRLTDSFFKALYSADVVALESDANKWIDELAEEGYGRYSFYDFLRNYGNNTGFYNSAFNLSFPKTNLFGYILQKEEELADAMMYRNSEVSRDFSEEQFLDMFIHQAGMKLNKKVTGLEDYKISRKMVAKSRKPDSKKDQKDSKKKRVNYYGEDGVYQQIENAYRNGNLDLLDSLEMLTAPSRNFLRWMLWERNKVMAKNFDSIVKSGKVLFAGVGAAHVPGDSGVVEELRRMGYTVRPVMGKNTRWAAKQKDIIDAVDVKQNMQSFISHRGDFSALFPGTPLDYTQAGNVEYFYPDMANGAYYKITRLPYYGALSNQSPQHVLNRIDSLLFENIPGKILEKKWITRNGHPGIDIKNQTSIGDHQRFMIFATPVNLWFIKVSGQRSFARKKNADDFFNSFQILEKTDGNWNKYSPQAGGYEINWPSQVVQLKSRRDTTKSLLGHADLHTSDKDGNYYFVREAEYPQYPNQWDEDTFDLNELINALNFNLKGKDLEIKHSKTGGTASAEASFFSQVANSKVYVKYIKIGIKIYLVGTKHKNEAEARKFLESFKLTPFRYHKKFETLTDSFLMFKTSTLEIPNFGKPKEDKEENSSNYFYGMGDYEDEDLKDTLEIQDHYKSTTYSYNSGESLSVSRATSSQFGSDILKDSTIASMKRKAKSDSKMIESIDSSSKNGWNILRFTMGDTSTTFKETHISIYRGRDEYWLAYYHDASLGITPFIKEFIDNFTPIDTAKNFRIPSNLRKDSVLKGIFHPDSLIRNNFRDIVSTIDWLYNDIPMLVNAAKKLNRFKEKDDEKRLWKYIVRKCRNKNHPAIIPYLKDIFYESADTVQQQIEILNFLSDMNNTEAAATFAKLIIEETPLTNSSWEMSSMLSGFRDTLKYSVPVFPSLFELLRYSEYKNDVIELAAKMLDSQYLKKESYLQYKNSLLMEFRDEWKREMASNTTGRDNSYSSGWDWGGSSSSKKTYEDEGYGKNVREEKAKVLESRYAYDYDDDDESKLIHLAKLLMPYFNEADISKRINKTVLSGKRPDRFNWVIFLLNNEKPVADSILKVFTGRPDYRWRLLSTKLPKAVADSLMPIMKDPQLMAYTFLSSENRGSQDSMVFLDKRSINAKDRKGSVYFYKHTYKNGYYDEWYLDWVLIPEDLTKVKPVKKDPAYYIRNAELNTTVPVKDQIDLQMEYLNKFDHPHWGMRELAKSQRRSYSYDF
jgi:uncharacterized protein YbaP (TraB family)